MRYRPEIDGLRAFAVVPVILFHAGIAPFQGGFVGVDVFFVISGYLIASICAAEMARGEFSFRRFYERRARRILPALYVVVAACFPAAWFWMDPNQYRDFAESVAAVVFFVSNILFWNQQDYFGQLADEKPLLHTWSLAVEEQFYLVFPLLLLLLWRLRPQRRLIVLLAVAAASLALSAYTQRLSPVANFYLGPTRAWELLAGVICALWRREGQSRLSPALRDGLATLGLAMICVAVFGFDEATPMPSALGLVPVLGTCLIILHGTAGGVAGRLLANPLAIGIGLISYSAYLWHQPLFAFARIRLLSEPASSLMLGLSVLSLGLAALQWRFVERPFRNRGSGALGTQRQIFAASAFGGAVLVAAAALVSNADAYHRRLPAEANYFASFADYAETPEHRDQTRWQCFLSDTRDSVDLFDPSQCLHLAKDKPNYLLLGDSHAAHLSLALREAYPGVNWLQATSSGCRPFLNPTGLPRCTELVTQILQDFLPQHRLDGIVWSARWGANDAKDMDATLAWLSPLADHVIMIGPTMAYTSYQYEILRDASRFGEADLSAVASRFIDDSRYPADEAARSVAEKYGARFVDILPVLCPDRTCRVISDSGAPMGFDRAHLTLPGSRTLVGMLKQAGALPPDLPGGQTAMAP